MTCPRHPDGDPDNRRPWCMDCHPEQYERYRESPTEAQPAAPPPPPPVPPVALPQIPKGRGFTAMEVAEVLRTDWRHRENVRRRVQELQQKYGLLDIIGERLGASTDKDNQVYHSNTRTLEALGNWDNGKQWPTGHLVRRNDRGTSIKAAQEMKNPGTTNHEVCAFFVSRGS